MWNVQLVIDGCFGGTVGGTGAPVLDDIINPPPALGDIITYHIDGLVQDYSNLIFQEKIYFYRQF